MLDELFVRYKQALAFVVEQRRKDKKISLQKTFYDNVRGFGIPSMISCSLFRDATPILQNGGAVSRVSIPYNIPRSGTIATTGRGNPIVSVRALKERIAIPIAMDGAYRRFTQALKDGWGTSAFRLGARKLFVTTKHYYQAELLRGNYDAVLGVDIGVKRLASVSIIGKSGNVLKQLYLGQDVGNRQRDISLRRSKLFAHRAEGSRYARQALRRLRRKEWYFTKTRSKQVAHEIMNLARRYNAFVAIEDLKNLNHARGGGRKGNRKAKRLPYSRLRAALESVASQDERLVVLVHPRGMSQECSRCASSGIRRRAVFGCRSCGYLGNADRNASVNIARRAALQRPPWGQISARNLSVMAGALVHAGAE